MSNRDNRLKGPNEVSKMSEIERTEEKERAESLRPLFESVDKPDNAGQPTIPDALITGLEQLKSGTLIDKGSFAEYADEDKSTMPDKMIKLRDNTAVEMAYSHFSGSIRAIAAFKIGFDVAYQAMQEKLSSSEAENAKLRKIMIYFNSIYHETLFKALAEVEKDEKKV